MKQIVRWILVGIAIILVIVANVVTAIGLVWTIQKLGAPIDMSPESILAMWILMSIAYYLFNTARSARK